MHTGGSRTACCLPSSQVLLSRVAPQTFRLPPILSTIQHCCIVGREKHGFFLLEEGSPSQLQNFAFVPFVFHNMLVSPFLDLMFQWSCLSVPTASLSLVSSADLMTVHPVASSRSLIKMLNRAGPSKYHYTTLVTHL